MTEDQKKLQRIVALRTKFMRKRWAVSEVDFSHKTYIEIRFVNNNDDFHANKVPFDVDKAIVREQEKLCKDLEEYVGGKEYMDELLEIMVG